MKNIDARVIVVGLLLVACAAVWGYVYGAYTAKVVDSRIEGMHEIECRDIVRIPNAYTGKYDIVCEIVMDAEDDNIRIFKGEGTLNDR